MKYIKSAPHLNSTLSTMFAKKHGGGNLQSPLRRRLREMQHQLSHHADHVIQHRSLTGLLDALPLLFIPKVTYFGLYPAPLVS